MNQPANHLTNSSVCVEHFSRCSGGHNPAEVLDHCLEAFVREKMSSHVLKSEPLLKAAR